MEKEMEMEVVRENNTEREGRRELKNKIKLEKRGKDQLSLTERARKLYLYHEISLCAKFIILLIQLSSSLCICSRPYQGIIDICTPPYSRIYVLTLTHIAGTSR